MNPIIDEVREARATLAEENGFDRDRIYRWAVAAHRAYVKSRSKPEQGGADQPATAVDSEADTQLQPSS